jgi:hypothetical protein
MDRRAALRSLVLTVPLAGCISAATERTGPRNPPKEPEEGPRDDPPAQVRIGEFDFEETDDGTLRVFGTVVNDGDARRTTTVRAIVDAAGNNYEKTTEVVVDAGTTAEFSVVFDIDYDEFARQGRVNVELN